MSLNVIVKPNADFTSGNITRALLNQAAKPTVAVAGSVGTEEIEALSITGAKIADDTLTGSKLVNDTITVEKLENLGRGFVIVGQAKSEDDNIDGGDTVALKLPQNGFLVGDGNDVKAMIFDNSASGAISMSQYTDSSTGDTSFKYDLRGQGVKSAHISSRAINLDKLSPNGGTASTDSTHSALISYDGGELADSENYGKAILTQAGGAGTVLRSGGKGEPMVFGGASYKTVEANADIAFTNEAYTVSINHDLKDNNDNNVVPSYVRCVIRCTDAAGDAGYAQNDEIDVTSLGNYVERFVTSVWANATQVGLSMAMDGGSNTGKLWAAHKTSPTSSTTETELDETKWIVKFYVSP